MKLIVEKAAFEAAIKSIASCGKRLDAAIHRVAVSAAVHTAKNGNPVHVNALIENMPKGSRVNAVREWFTRFGPVSYNSETKLFETDKEHAKLMLSEMAAGAVVPSDVLEGISTPWTDLKPEGAYVPIDFTAMIVKAVTTAQKRIDADENKGDKIDQTLLSQITELVLAE